METIEITHASNFAELNSCLAKSKAYIIYYAETKLYNQSKTDQLQASSLEGNVLVEIVWYKNVMHLFGKDYKLEDKLRDCEQNPSHEQRWDRLENRIFTGNDMASGVIYCENMTDGRRVFKNYNPMISV